MRVNSAPGQGNRSEVLIGVVAAGTAITWFSAWLTGLIVDPGSWPLRYTLQGVGFLIASALVAIWMWTLYRQQRIAQSFFDTLSHVDAREAADLDAANLPEISPSSPWYESAQRIRTSFTENCRRAFDAEHARAALDVRLQREKLSQQQIQSILDGLREPILAVDAFGEVVLANPSAEKLFGFSRNQAIDRELADIVDCEPLVEALGDIRRRKTPTHRTIELSVPQGDTEGWYSVVASPLPMATPREQGETPPHGAAAVFRDIGGHKAAQRRNAEFVSSVSHEMKTPLAGIKAYVELLADGDAEDDTTREEFLNVINSQTDRLQRLIDNLLNLARIEAGVVNVNKHPRSLNELLEEAFNVVLPSAEAKQIQLAADLSPLYLGVLVDRDMLLQAAINLLSNAIKYTPDGGTVTLRSRMQDNEIVFEVEDTGVGLAEEDREKVFQKFYRVRKDRRMAQGTGLGLPLAKHIVEDVHGGRLDVSSTLGEGSTFRIVLPNAGRMTHSTQLVS